MSWKDICRVEIDVIPRCVRRMPNVEYDRLAQRYTPEIMFGFSKKVMVHVGSTFSNMHTNTFRWESMYIYGKYRFISNDDIHQHFRMAVFGEAAYSRSRFHYETELSIDELFFICGVSFAAKRIQRLQSA